MNSLCSWQEPNLSFTQKEYDVIRLKHQITGSVAAVLDEKKTPNSCPSSCIQKA